MASKAQPAARRRQRGAALLIMITVIGIGAGMLLMNTMSRSGRELERERRTVAALSAARDAMLGFALQQGRLPRPATSATNGVENPAPCTNEQDCTGFIPWATLGVEPTDGWGKLLRYSVMPAYTAYPVYVYTFAANKVVLGRETNGTMYYVEGAPACTVATQCAPAVLYSSGRRNLGTSAAGVAQANGSATNVDEIHNDGATNRFISRPATEDALAQGGEFDDIVAWVPFNQLTSRMRANRVLP